MWKACDVVAWDMLDGNVMAGRVDEVRAGGWLMVKRVDGTVCGPIPPDKVRRAGPDDVDRAIGFFTR